MAIINLGQQDLEIGNDWHQFTSAVVAPGDIVPLRILMISSSPSDLISRAIVRYSVEAPFPGGTIYQVNGGFEVFYSGRQQLFTINLPPFPDDIGRLHVEAKRFYRFRSFNPGSDMELSIEFESDHVRNIDDPDMKFTTFTHGPISQNGTGTLDFSGLTAEYQILAVWLDMANPNQSDSMDVDIKAGGNVVSRFVLSGDEVPWIVPANVISSVNTIDISPSKAVDGVILYAREVENTATIAV